MKKIKETTANILEDDSWVHDYETRAIYYGVHKGLKLLFERLQSIAIEPPKLEIVIIESDLEDLKRIVYENSNIHWEESLDGVGLIDIELISQDESVQREK
jgi:hypothetical protein